MTSHAWKIHCVFQFVSPAAVIFSGAFFITRSNCLMTSLKSAPSSVNMDVLSV